LKKEWSAAGKNILIADAYCASLLEWLDNQKEGQEGKFEAVNVKDV
jgi:glutathione S-transferase